jgi:hypothetical protein
MGQFVALYRITIRPFDPPGLISKIIKMSEKSFQLIATLSKFVLEFWKKLLKLEEMARKTFDSTNNQMDE